MYHVNQEPGCVFNRLAAGTEDFSSYPFPNRIFHLSLPPATARKAKTYFKQRSLVLYLGLTLHNLSSIVLQVIVTFQVLEHSFLLQTCCCFLALCHCFVTGSLVQLHVSPHRRLHCASNLFPSESLTLSLTSTFTSVLDTISILQQDKTNVFHPSSPPSLPTPEVNLHQGQCASTSFTCRPLVDITSQSCHHQPDPTSFSTTTIQPSLSRRV